MKKTRLATAFCALLLSHTPSRAAAASYVTIEDAGGGRFDVKFGGQLFTTLHTKEYPKPILYPIVGPGDTRMTRDYPMVKGTPGEASDHPHHQSLWFTHGDVNGVDFWSLGKGRIVTEHVEEPVHGGSEASIVLRDRWIAPDDKVVCTDTQRIAFHKPVVVEGREVIALDYEVTLHASEGDVTFGDTKEGTMAIRTNPALRIDKGAKASNSEGIEGGAIWGKRARWVAYSGEVGAKMVGIAIFDSPSNPRYPTWWHARDYGLVGANPFGIHDFEKKEPHAGDLKLEKGKSLTFRYRFLFHEGRADDIKMAERYREWAAQDSAKAAEGGEGADGFTSLFDGRTLDRWEQKGGAAKYRVEDGAILGETVPNTPNSFLCTKAQYGDFVLEYEFLCDDGLNSGVQVRSAVSEAPLSYRDGDKTIQVPAGRVHGYQVEIDPDKPNRMWTGGIYDEGRRGWLYPGSRGGDARSFSEAGKRLYRKGEWNQVRVEARGPSIKTWLNGEARASIEDSMTLRGVIALQVHGVGGRAEALHVRWRRLRVRPLAE